MYSSSYSTHLSALSTLSQPKSYICVHIWAVPAAALSSWGDWWCLFWCLDLKRALHQTQCVHAEKKKKKKITWTISTCIQQLSSVVCLFFLFMYISNKLSHLIGGKRREAGFFSHPVLRWIAAKLLCITADFYHFDGWLRWSRSCFSLGWHMGRKKYICGGWKMRSAHTSSNAFVHEME